jgi:hypothetical protein
MFHVYYTMDRLCTYYGHGKYPCGSITDNQVVFLSFHVLFMVMNFIHFMMYEVCGYEIVIVECIFHILIIGIMDHYRLLWYWSSKQHIIHL